MNDLGDGRDLNEIEKEDMYRQIVEYSFETTIIHADHKVLYINSTGADFLRAKKEDIVGGCVLDIIQDDYKEAIKARIHKVMTENKPAELIEQTMLKLDGTPVDVEVNCTPVLFGNKRAIQSVLRDITKRRETEQKLKEMTSEIFAVSTPIVPVSEGIAVVPIVGQICEGRVAQLLDSIPQNIVKYSNTNILIIDFSGIYNLDEVVVDFLFRINAILTLLGVQPVLTGIRPELAKMAIAIGKNLSDIQTFGNIKIALSKLAKIK
jgi:PAS domain S-box-containing protein